MTERPILFSAPMIKAILAGTKTQTRRVAQLPNEVDSLHHVGFRIENMCKWYEMRDKSGAPATRPRGKHFVDSYYTVPFAVGDRLWVREAWRTFVSLDKVKPTDLLDGGRGGAILYEADGAGLALGKEPNRERHYSEVRDDFRAFGKLRPGIFMPRWASRITLAVTDVRVQRLHEITEADAKAEGITKHGRFYGVADADWDTATTVSAREAFLLLWQEINGKRAPWWSNPFVVAVSFERVEQ